MKEFSIQYPQVQYHLFSGQADDIKERIDKGLIDFGLLTEPVDIEKYDFARLNYKDRWGIIVPNDSVLASKEHVTPQDLINQPLLIPQRSIVQNEIAHWFGEDHEKLNIIATHNLIYNAAIWVAEGMGYAFTIDKLFYGDEEIPVTFVPLYPTLETGTVIVWKKHQIFSPAMSRLIEKIRQTFKA